jgi:hypothetical protein
MGLGVNPKKLKKNRDIKTKNSSSKFERRLKTFRTQD